MKADRLTHNPRANPYPLLCTACVNSDDFSPVGFVTELAEQLNAPRQAISPVTVIANSAQYTLAHSQEAKSEASRATR